MTKKKLFLFPGAHKTATSLLQAALESHRTALEGLGFSIAPRQVFYRSGMREFLLRKTDTNMVDMQAWDTMAENVLGPSWQDRDLIISIENIFGEVNPLAYNGARQCIDTLQTVLPDHDIEVVFYIRRQDSFLESVFLQNTHRGLEKDVDTFINEFAEGRPFDWLEILEPVIKRVGQSSVRIVPFETIKAGPRAYIMKFFRNFTDLSRKELLSTYEDLEDTNVSLSELGLRIARAGFAEIPEMRDRRILTKALQREFGVDRYPRFKLPGRLRAGIIERHRDLNERLIETKAIPPELAPYYLFQENTVPYKKPGS